MSVASIKARTATEHIRVDSFHRQSPGKTPAPAADVLLSFVREGDTVVVHSGSPCSQLDDLRRLVQGLTQRRVCIEFVKEHLTFTGEDSPMANHLSVMGHSPSSSER
nr:Mobile element protein [Escherichia coli]